MALGNLVNGVWRVAGVFNPTTKQFIERAEIIQWPKTGKSAPRSWLSCKPGERLTSRAREVQRCEPCQKGTFSVGGTLTFCLECTPGEHRICARAAASMQQTQDAANVDAGYFQPDEGQFGCLNCDSLGDFYQDLAGQLSCKSCAANTQRFVGVLTAVNRSACQCKPGA